MKLIYLGEKIEPGKSIYLAGSFEEENDSFSWRKKAIKKLEELGYDGIVYIPEYKDKKEDISDPKISSWIEEAIKNSTQVIYYMVNNKRCSIERSTTVEFDHFTVSDSILYGRENPCNNYSSKKYLDGIYKANTGRKPFENLDELIAETVKLLKEKYEKKESVSKIIERLKENKSFIRDIAKILTDEERRYIVNGLVNKTCSNCEKKEVCKTVGKYDCPSWNNDYEIGCARVFKTIRSEKDNA